MTDGSRFARLASGYRKAAILVFNTLLLCVLLELVARLALRIGARESTAAEDPTRAQLGLSYYASRPWSARYWKEHREALDSTRYEPFAIWRNAAYTGSLLNIDANRLRRTPGSRCGSGSRRIYVLGGSTAWGWGSPDWGTIPAYLQAALTARGGDVCVVNYAQMGYVVMQELIELERRLAAGDVPDLVVAYDGFNECRQAWNRMEAGSHLWQSRVAAVFEPRPLLDLLRSTAVWKLAARARTARRDAPASATPGPSVRPDSLGRLADATAAHYFAADRAMRALSHEYGFAYVHFVQPWLGVTGKRLSAEERTFRPPPYRELCTALYQRLKSSLPRSGLVDLGDAFNDMDSTVFVDEVHVTPAGNERIAARILARLPAAAPVRGR